MLKLFKSGLTSLFLFGLLFTSIAFAQPKNIQLEYEVSHNGKPFGTVKETYIQEGDQYRIVSTTKGQGIYALLGERVLTSNGVVTAEGLKPNKFHLKRGDNARKSLTANFDWATNALNMLVKGETRTAKLAPGTQDLVSYAYQIMFTPPKVGQVKVALTTGKKLKKYTFNVEQGPTIKAAGKNYETLHLARAKVDGKKKKELWIGKVTPEYSLPVKYMMVDKRGDKIEQVLTKLSIQ